MALPTEPQPYTEQIVQDLTKLMDNLSKSSGAEKTELDIKCRFQSYIRELLGNYRDFYYNASSY